MYPTLTPAQEFRRHWTLIRALAERDIRARYRRSLLGPFWAILQPVMLMLVFTALSGVLDVPSDGIPYAVFSYSVLVPWTFFANIISRAAPSIIGNATLIKKIRLSRELFPAVVVVTAAFDALMAGLVLAVLMLWYAIPLGVWLLWLPLLVVLVGLFGLAVGMFLAALGVYRRDFLQINGFFLQLWMYLTPIIYPLEQVPERWQALYKLNPMVGLLEGFRSVLARGQSPDLGLLAWSLPGIALALLVAWPLFRFTSRYFADAL